MEAIASTIGEVLSNRILLAILFSWSLVQTLKAALYWLMNKEWSWERLVGSGGMPSSHSATVCALAVSAMIEYGLGSFQFAISVVLAIIVLHDARGVRLEAGRQAEILNEIMRNWQQDHNPFSNKVLKELIGHTPLQVVVGALMGILIAVIIYAMG